MVRFFSLISCFLLLSISACLYTEVKIEKQPFEFKKLSKIYSTGGAFTTAEILQNIKGDKQGYTIKLIGIIYPADIVTAEGKAPNIQLKFKKIGNFTATLVLIHPTKTDLIITKAMFEVKRPLSSPGVFTFTKLVKPYTVGGAFSATEIKANVIGKKEGYVLKSVSAFVPANIVDITGVASGISLPFKKSGKFLATLVFSHPIYPEVTVTDAAFEITKSTAEVLTFTKLSKSCANNVFTAADILNNISGNKTGYTLKSIGTITPGGIARVSGVAPNFTMTFSNTGTVTNDLILQHDFKQDATITGAEFELNTFDTATLTYNGKTYNTIQIGKQVWMVDNLNEDSFGGTCYNNNPANCVNSGRLYTWNEAQTVNISGWHLPTDKEWGDLEVALGMNDSERNRPFGNLNTGGNTTLPLADKLKSGGSYNCFNFVTAGHYSGTFMHLSNDVYYWTASENGGEGIFRALFNSSRFIQRGKVPKSNNGFTIRLVKD